MRSGTSKHKPLVQHMCELLLAYLQQHDPEALCPDPEQQQQQLTELLHANSLLQYPHVYRWLHSQLAGLQVRPQQLAGLQVRTELGSSCHIFWSIAYLDPRSPADIMLLPDTLGGLQAISCFEYNKRKYTGSERQLTLNPAGQPLLPCIGVLRPGVDAAAAAAAVAAAAAGGSSDDARRFYLSYPVEACELVDGKAKKRPGGLAKVPAWIEDVISSSSSSSSSHEPQIAAEQERAASAARPRAAAAAAPAGEQEVTAVTAAPVAGQQQ
uniref:Uncharacterized protein n=1 Tax=Tetradesmus obliquus TaxID=3088 RepID=A0A383WC73_TETOB|eukprot:jgi/Sobl393_1/11127/SZX74634.1